MKSGECQRDLTAFLVRVPKALPSSGLALGSVVSTAPRLPNQWVRLVPARLVFALVFFVLLVHT